MNLLMGSSFDMHSHLGQGSGFGLNFGEGGHSSNNSGQSGHGSGGFGHSGHDAGFGKNHTSYAGTLAHHHYSRHRQMTGGHPGMMQRQKSLLSSMTHSKNDTKPMYFSSFSYPQGKEGQGGGLISGYYEKPPEKKRPPLARQKSVIADSPPGPRLNRSLSVGATSSSPPLRDQRARPPLRSSLSVAVPSKSLYSDRNPIERRSLDKDLFLPLKDLPPARRKSLRRRSSITKIPLIGGLAAKFGKSRSVSEPSPAQSVKDLSSAPEIRSSRDSVARIPSDSEESKLILGLMNPESSDPMQDSSSPHTNSEEKPVKHSPVTVHPKSRVFVVSTDIPVSTVTVSETKQVKPPPSPCTTTETSKDVSVNASPKVVRRSDSDSPEVFYDCVAAESPKLQHEPKMERVRISPRDYFKNFSTEKVTLQESEAGWEPAKYEPHSTPTQSVKNIVDRINKLTAQTEESRPVDLLSCEEKPQRKPLSAMASFTYHIEPDEDCEEEDVPLYHPSDRHRLFSNISDINESDEEGEEEESIQKLDLPEHAEYGSGKNTSNNGTCTTDSSESGYATSARHNSPRESDIKSAFFVNQLPAPGYSVTRLEEDIVMSGSGNDTDNDDDVFQKGSTISLAECVTGSDTDDNESDRVEDCKKNAWSNLEVMKILDSPTNVRERLEPKMASRQRSSPTAVVGKTKKHHSKSGAENDSYSPSASKDTDFPTQSGNTPKHRSLPIDAECVIMNETPNEPAPESPLSVQSPQSPKHSKKFSNSFVHALERPLLSFRRQQSEPKPEDKVTSALDCALHIINLLLFLISCGVLGIGIWLLLKDFNMNQISEIFGNNILQCIVYIVIAASGVAMLTTLCLCCGIKQDRVGLGFYAFMLVLVVIAFTTAAILSGIFGDKLNGVELRFIFKDKLVLNYGSNNSQSEVYFTQCWNTMQRTFSCCGAYGNVNDTSSWALYRESKWFHNLPSGKHVHVPESCCVSNKNVDICQQGDPRLFGPPRYGPPMQEHFNHVNPHLNTEGCYEKVSKYLLWLTSVIAIATGSVAALFFLVAILTWFFCFKVNTEEFEDYYSKYSEDEEDDDEEEEEEQEEEDDEVFEDSGSFEMKEMGAMTEELRQRRDQWNRSDTQTDHFFSPVTEEESGDEGENREKRRDSQV